MRTGATLAQRAVAVVAAGSLAFAQGCASLSPPARMPLSPGAQAELTASREPLVVRWTATERMPAPTDCLATRIAGIVSEHIGDTLRFRSVSELDTATPGDTACVARSTATVVASAEDARRIQVVRISAVQTVFGFVFFTAGVGVAILLIVSVTDGVIDAVGRWF